jgi:hypothetical protein
MITIPLKLEERTEFEPNTGCWLWTGALGPGGYGISWWPKQNSRAHRAMYESLRGPVPPGLVLDHLCRLRCCVNPWHMEPVTIGENVLRGVGRAAMQARQTACHLGHPFDEQNTYLWNGKRQCRTCQRDRYRARCANPWPAIPRQTSCRRGHPLVVDNVYITPTGQRMCRACQRINGRKRDALLMARRRELLA